MVVPTVLANNQILPEDIVTDGTDVFWGTKGGGGNVMMVSVNGGSTSTIATGYLSTRLGFDTQHIFWADANSGVVAMCQKADCNGVSGPPIVLATGASSLYPAGVAVYGGNAYWTMNNGAQGAIYKVPGGGGQVSTVTQLSTAAMPMPSGGIVADSSGIYWTGTTNSKNGVWKCPTSFCAAQPPSIDTTAQGANYMAQDTANVYWTESTTGNVLTCPKTGCGASPTKLATGQQSPNGITTDGVDVYWTNGDSIMSCAVGGCGSNPTVFASGQAMPFAVAVDTVSVYWTNQGNGTVVKLAK